MILFVLVLWKQIKDSTSSQLFPPISQHGSNPARYLFPWVAHVLEALVALIAVVVGDAGGEDGDVPQPWVVHLLRLNIHTALGATLHQATTALGQVEDVSSKQVALLLQVVGLLPSDKGGTEEDQLERSPHLTRWDSAD